MSHSPQTVEPAAVKEAAGADVAYRLKDLPDSALIKLSAVQALLGGVSRSTIWAWERGTCRFPKRVRLTEDPNGPCRWVLGEVLAWLNNRPRVGGGE